MPNLDACLIIHYDMFGEEALYHIPFSEITKYCRDSDLPIIAVAGYNESVNNIEADAVLYPPDNDWPTLNTIKLLENKSLLITGGFKSLCVRELCEKLKEINCKLFMNRDHPTWLEDPVFTIDPDWIWNISLNEEGELVW